MPSLPTLGLRNRANRQTRARVPEPAPRSSSVVDCAVYVAGERLDGEWTHEQAITEVRQQGSGFAWIGLHEPDEEQINGVADMFGLHELAVEDAIHAHQRPKLERYGDMLFMVLKTVRYVAHESPETTNEIVETGEIMVFLGRDFVITVRHGKHAGLAAVRRSLEADPEQLALGPAAVLHAVSDQVVDSYLAVTDGVQDDIDATESAVFAPRTMVDSEELYMMKREIMELRRALMPLGEPLRRLAEGYTPMVPDQVRSYFRNVEDHLTTVADRVSGFDELLTSLMDANGWKITLRLNIDMRKISAWVAIISTPTMIAGIYGMNFEVMPETKWTYGYPTVLAVMMVCCVVLYRIFRRNRWL